MATEEVNKPSSLPDYSEMILAAIEALNGKEGSSKTAISDYIGTTYGDLPENHSTLLTTHLTKLKDSGDLVLVKNNYMKATSDAPPKRGRGRPPKPKSDLPADAVVSPPRPRGRPPKAKDPLAVASPTVMKKTASPSPSGRGRGRPPRSAETSSSPAVESPSPAPVVTPSAVPPASPRPRGRPPKVKAQVAVGV